MKDSTGSNFFEMLRHHHSTASIDVAMVKQHLQKDKGLGTSGKRGTTALRLEAICQFSMQLQHNILMASSATVDETLSDLSK